MNDSTLSADNPADTTDEPMMIGGYRVETATDADGTRSYTYVAAFDDAARETTHALARAGLHRFIDPRSIYVGDGR
jgi:hypothetical protein